jgi:uncharacterized protein YjgD (DUF1641 family)
MGGTGERSEAVSDERPAGGVDLPPEVRAAIAEHPEAVAGLLRRSGQLTTLLDAVALIEDAADDRMVEGVTVDATHLGLAASELAEEGTVELGASVGANGRELAAAVERVAALERSGSLDRVVELADAFALVTDAMDDRMVESLAATGSALGEVASTAADEDVQRGLTRTLEAVGRAETGDPEATGAVGLVKALRDPEVKAGLGYLLAVARGIGAADRTG